MKFLLITLFTLLSFNIQANNYFCNESVGELPIQAGGRVKPLRVHAKEVIKHLTGKRKVNGYSSVMSYCLLSASGFGLPNKLIFETKIEHNKTRALLNNKTSFNYDELIEEKQTIRLAWQKEKINSGYKKELGKLLSKISLYESISGALDWTVAQNNGGEVAWIPLRDYFSEEKIAQIARTTNENPFIKSLNNAKKEYDAAGKSIYKTEILFDKMQLTRFSMLFCLLALAAMVLFKKTGIALGLSAITVILQTIYIILRVYISGRAPITNMYETVLFSGYGGLVIAMLIAHFKKEKIFVFMGLGYNFCTLMMINFADGMLTPSISPLVPVLRDNFWLSTHVTTIILSYGALALSWILANTIIVKKFFSRLSRKDEIYYNDVMYTALKYGIVSLAAGIILGGVWADYSWGRFWGWDPKETWSLIVLCIYMAILHGKYTNWIKHEYFSHLVAASFMSLMMAWFGVNYILASGLHSYGFSEGGAYFLGTFFTVQTLILIITYKNLKGPGAPAQAA